ncbi:hypothetical protein [Erwinia sp. CGal63]|uniref:hypothetical protein n=1 Tax=Erwinia sp. CGal63 TaxID=2919889 RepID=UPI003007FDE5
MNGFNKSDQAVLNDKLACLITLVLSWGNAAVFILSAVCYYSYFMHTSVFILPIAILNLCTAVALTLLIFCLLELRACARRVPALLAIGPSLLVLLLKIYFSLQQGAKWTSYFIST